MNKITKEILLQQLKEVRGHVARLTADRDDATARAARAEERLSEAEDHLRDFEADLLQMGVEIDG